MPSAAVQRMNSGGTSPCLANASGTGFVSGASSRPSIARSDAEGGTSTNSHVDTKHEWSGATWNDEWCRSPEVRRSRSEPSSFARCSCEQIAVGLERAA